VLIGGLSQASAEDLMAAELRHMHRDSGVHNPSVIDFVARDPETGDYILVMFEGRAWDDSPERCLQIQTKVNAYLAFILDGQMRESYPDSIGKAVQLELHCLYEPSEYVLRFMTQLARELALHGLSIAVHVLDD
jgi:hypothetical protein